MTTITIEMENNIADYAKTKGESNLNMYISKLIKEDMLLNEINKSKESGVNKLNSFNDLDK